MQQSDDTGDLNRRVREILYGYFLADAQKRELALKDASRIIAEFLRKKHAIPSMKELNELLDRIELDRDLKKDLTTWIEKNKSLEQGAGDFEADLLNALKKKFEEKKVLFKIDDIREELKLELQQRNLLEKTIKKLGEKRHDLFPVGEFVFFTNSNPRAVFYLLQDLNANSFLRLSEPKELDTILDEFAIYMEDGTQLVTTLKEIFEKSSVEEKTVVLERLYQMSKNLDTESLELFENYIYSLVKMDPEIVFETNLSDDDLFDLLHKISKRESDLPAFLLRIPDERKLGKLRPKMELLRDRVVDALDSFNKKKDADERYCKSLSSIADLLRIEDRWFEALRNATGKRAIFVYVILFFISSVIWFSGGSKYESAFLLIGVISAGLALLLPIVGEWFYWLAPEVHGNMVFLVAQLPFWVAERDITSGFAYDMVIGYLFAVLISFIAFDTIWFAIENLNWRYFRSKPSAETKMTFTSFKYVLMTTIIFSIGILIPKDPLKDLTTTGMLILLIIFLGAPYVYLKRYLSVDRRINNYRKEIQEHLSHVSIGKAYTATRSERK